MLQPKIDTEGVLARARSTSSLFEVGKVAADMLAHHYPKGAGLVLSPITSGGKLLEGKPSHRENIRALEEKISQLSEGNDEDTPIFNQLMFKGCIDQYRKLWELSDKSHTGAYYDLILHEFYGPILSTGLINVGFFMHGWRRSRSSIYVHRKLSDSGKKIVLLN
jgi:hypothetical protein